LDLITNNEQLKQIIRFSKFLLWKIWRNFESSHPVVCGHLFIVLVPSLHDV